MNAPSDLFNSSLKCFPNPFSNSTTISFSLPQSEKVSIKIFDMTGRLVKTFAIGEMQKGVQQIEWNATDEKGNALDAGIYFLKLETENYSETKKLSVVR
ncbi:MAG: T9SS type A sorting domain-containing protein [Bacteroidota bacterium]